LVAASSEELEGLLQQLSEYEKHLYSQPYFNTSSSATSAAGSLLASGSAAAAAVRGGAGGEGNIEARVAEGGETGVIGPEASYDLGSASSLSWSQTLQSLEDFELKLSKGASG
jgi:hypothetical protein